MKLQFLFGSVADSSAASTSRHQATYRGEDGSKYTRETQKYSDGDYLDYTYLGIRAAGQPISAERRPDSPFSEGHDGFGSNIKFIGCKYSAQ